jgi:hypothetical protein
LPQRTTRRPERVDEQKSAELRTREHLTHGSGAAAHVRRVKNGTPSTHPIHGDELRALRQLRRENQSSSS